MINELRENIISQLTFYKESWRQLTEVDNLYLIGKIESMDMAICVVNEMFDNAKGEREKV